MLAQARAQAEALLAEARARGEDDGAAIAAAERRRVRARIRATVLGAQRASYEEFREQARAAARALRDDSRYPALRARLARFAQAIAGRDAAVSEHPDGGVVAEAPGRYVDCSLHALADRAVDALGAEVEGLWAP